MSLSVVCDILGHQWHRGMGGQFCSSCGLGRRVRDLEELPWEREYPPRRDNTEPLAVCGQCGLEMWLRWLRCPSCRHPVVRTLDGSPDLC